MSECQYGCTRDFLIRDLVTFRLAMEDAADELLRSIRSMHEAGSDPVLTDKLLRCHEEMCRPLADDANKIFDICGPVDGQHRAFDPIAWLAAEKAKQKVTEAA